MTAKNKTNHTKQNTKQKKASPAKPKAKSKLPSKVKAKKQAPAKRKNTAKEDFVQQNIMALFLLVFGMVFLISITTNALGPLGTFVKSILLGQFALIAVFMALAMIFLGASRLVYNTRFSLKDISPIMLILIFAGAIIFYGGINASSVQAESLSLVLLKAVFVESIVGDNIGIIPYATTFALVRVMGKAGMLITSLTMFLFVGVYYFKLTFSKVGDASSAIAQESGKFARNIKAKTLDFVTVDEDEDRGKSSKKTKKENKILKQEKRMPEKLDKTVMDDQFYFLEKYKSDISEFAEVKDDFAEPKDNFAEPKDDFAEPKDDFAQPKDRISLSDLRQEVGDRLKEPMPLGNPISAPLNETFEEAESMIGPEAFQDEVNQINSLSQRSAEEEGFQESLRLHKPEKTYQGSENGATKQYRGLAQKIIEVENNNNNNKEGYTLPKTDLLQIYPAKGGNTQKQIDSSKRLEETLEIFGIEAKVVNISTGPTITRYELQPKMGVKVSKILNLSDDLALALAAVAPIRIEAPIPGTSLVGIEVPNGTTEVVGFKEIVETSGFKDPKKDIPIVLGRDVSGKPIIEDIARMPHLLVAGSTGSGKSVCINTLICSILYKFKPEEIKLIMIDPKMVELSVYNDIPHLLIPVVTDMKKAPYALSWAVSEMNKRYKLFAENRARDLKGYNKIPGIEKLPRIVIVVDELADLMMVSPNEVEDSIIRLAQKARACGMHLVIATQRPSVDVITGLIKANIPSRIAFAVSSQIDSRTILDQAGAEKLIGKGDMLFSHPSIPKPQRIQGSFISDKEVNDIVDHIIRQNTVKEKPIDIIEETIQNHIEEQKEEERDPLLDEIIEFAIQNKQLSTSLIQRRFKVGYNRASRIIDALEEMGVVSESDGAKPRKVLISSSEAIN